MQADTHKEVQPKEPGSATSIDKDFIAAMLTATREKSRIYNFTVAGNPVPYLRMTQGQVKLMRIPDHRISKAGAKVKAQIRRYLQWKEWVQVHAFGLKFNPSPRKKVYLNVVAYFPDKTHGDPENIKKGIQDALFKQDKHIIGFVDYHYDTGNPRCEVQIIEPAEPL